MVYQWAPEFKISPSCSVTSIFFSSFDSVLVTSNPSSLRAFTNTYIEKLPESPTFSDYFDDPNRIHSSYLSND